MSSAAIRIHHWHHGLLIAPESSNKCLSSQGEKSLEINVWATIWFNTVCMCVSMYIIMCAHISAHIYTHIHTYTRTQTQTHTHVQHTHNTYNTYSHVHMFVCVSVGSRQKIWSFPWCTIWWSCWHHYNGLDYPATQHTHCHKINILLG